MPKPYRVIVWSPSNLGGACIREILRLPDFELVGVFGYSDSKNGADIGTLLGLPPCGVRVTTSRDAILALPADCVIYTGAPPFDWAAMETDIEQLLLSGKNVVSATSFFYAPFHGQAFVDRFEAACAKGGVSVHGTGENGGFMLERLATTLSALTGTVERVKLQESVYVGTIPAATLGLYGFGLDPADATDGPVNAIFKRWMFVESVSFACKALFGREPERIEHTPIYEPSAEDVHAESITIRRGQTRFVRHVFNAWLDGRPRVTIELLWYVRHADAPFGAEGGAHDKWKIEIEGQPTSLRMTLEAVASIDRKLDLHPGDPTIPSYYATASILLQAVPVVCAAPPGIVYANTFSNAVEDFHRLATRHTLVS